MDRNGEKMMQNHCGHINVCRILWKSPKYNMKCESCETIEREEPAWKQEKKNSHTHSLTLVLFSKWIWSEEKPAPAFYWYVIWFTMFAKHLQWKSETSIQWNFESGIGTKGKHFGIAWAKEGLLFLSQFTVYSTVFSLSHSLAMDFFLRTVSAWNSSIQRC